MTLPKYAIQIILLILFFVAAGVRFSATTELSTPYYKGTSAMNYRHVAIFGEGESLNEPSRKANWPEGYRPDAYRAAGAEYTIGLAFRVARYLGELDGRRFVRRWLVLMFSSLVIVMYLVARRYWDCQAGGLIAAFIAAFYSPIVSATNGRSFEHATIAFFLVALHWLATLRYLERPGPLRAFVAGLYAFGVVAVWEYGAYYVLVAAFALTFFGKKQRPPVLLLSAHAAAVLFAAVLLPHARAVGLAASWPTLCLASLAIYAGFSPRIGSGWRGVAFVAAATLVLTVAMTPLRSGVSEGISAVQWFAHRVRFLFGKPVSPLHLPDTIRYLWTESHAPPSPHALIRFWLPGLLFGGASILAMYRAGSGWRRSYAIAILVAAATAVAYTLDRSAATLAGVGVALVAGGAGRGISRVARSRGAVAALGAYVLLAELIFPLGAPNPTLQIARAAGVAHRETHGYTWVSLASTDRELVRYVATRTSVKDPFFGNPDITSVLLTFSGRTAVLPIGSFSKAGAAKHIDWYRLMYGKPGTLREACVGANVRYVLYSIDFLLDSSRYSPRYLAGLSAVTEESAVWQFHFNAQTIEGFTLVYENEHFRLYEVTDRPEPTFITDHPPVYQLDFLERSGGDVDEFNQDVIDVMLTYNEGLAAKARGEEFEALQLFSWCLERAPGFTRARVALGTTLAQMGRHEDALETFNLVLAYAPDDAEALYAAAYANARLGKTDMAKDLLDILFSSPTREKEILDKARLLQTLIEQDIPLDSPVAP